ncbi:MAG: glycosyltransferase family 2 protein [Leptospiraceae bacterium]|nr:glycosyltransferase family 2 protein [Leptospiraceae bacterium]MCP5502943.1 glycosyltransferase family 2 protein [Leptospiraceae bacterium]
MKPKLSVAIITYNEEKNIRDCIRSCEELADEIVVLDSFSTDKTEEIVRSFPKVRFSTREFTGHIEQKNRAIELCTGDWVLSLDADERVSPELKESITAVLEKKEDYNGYRIARLTYHLGRYIRHSGWYPQMRYRLFKKGLGRWKGENPHDFLEIEGKGGKLKGDIIHFSFKDLSHQVDTINKFSSIVSYTRHKKGQKFSVFMSLLKPISKFLEIYIYKLGFLDGYPGFVIAVSSAFSTFLKYAKIYEYDKGYIQRPSNIREDYGNST